MPQYTEHTPDRGDQAYYQDAVTQLIALPVDGFLNNMVEQLARILNCDGVLLAQCYDIPNGLAQPLAFWCDNQLTATDQFNIADSPCDSVGNNGISYQVGNAQKLFPNDRLISHYQFNTYSVAPLINSKGLLIGYLAVMAAQERKQQYLMTILSAFAGRAGFELERLLTHEDFFARHYYSMLSATDDLMSYVDTNYIYRAINSAYCKKFNKSINDIVNRSVIDLHGEEVFYGGLKHSLDQSLIDGLTTKTEFSRPAPDGSTRWIQGQHNPVYDVDNKIIGVVVAARDITELKNIQQALAKSEQRLQSMYDDMPSMFFTVNQQVKISSINVYGANYLGYTVEQLLNSDMAKLFHLDDRAKFIDNLALCFAEPEIIHDWELRKIHHDGHVIWVKETVRVVKDQNQVPRLFIVSEDISEKHKLSQKLSYQASHDPLTDLINRHEFERLLENLLAANANEDSCEHVLCYLDLDQFKIVNDDCGHLAGDILLKNIAEILKLKVRKSDVLARLGGDEFAILMEFCSLEQAKSIADSVRQLIQDYKFIWKTQVYSVGVSIGLVVINTATDNLTKVMGAADEACYAAKDAGRNRLHVYRESDQEISRRRGEMAWFRRIKNAIVDNKFCLYAQQINPVDDSLNIKPSYELLLRLNDNGSIISPDAFFPAAERYHLATKIDEWVIVTAFRWLASSESNIGALEHCAINLSGHSLSDDDFLDYVMFQIERFNIPGHKICFEITETAAISNLAGALRFIEQFQLRGCSFALDDFGSGVSSFGYLKNLPVDFVKIDGSFVADMANDPIDYAMVRSINDIAHVMNKKTIAEYVENEQTFECLKELGVDFVQGHYIGKPQLISQPK